MTMSGYIVVFIGGGLGAVLRHVVNRASVAYLGSGLPYGTMFVNIMGGLLMGALTQLLLARPGVNQEFRLFLATGVLGGFTTFSAFSLEAATMWQRGAYQTLGAYIVGSVLLSIGAVFAGMAFARTFSS